MLPRPGADAESLRRAGRMLCKSLLDDHPIGAGLCAFVLEYLIGMHEQRSFRSPRSALSALDQFDPVLAAHPGQWRVLLERTVTYGCRLYYIRLQVLAAQWRVLLERTEDPSRLEGLSPSDLGGTDDELSGSGYGADHDVPLSERNVAAAVLAGCKARLLGCRRSAFEALREGFVGLVDLSVQLAPLPTSELLLMVRPLLSTDY